MGLEEMLQQAALPLEDGSWVTQEMLNTAEAIYETFPDIEVLWIPRKDREEGDPVFALIQRDTREVVMYIDKEDDFNRTLLKRLHLADTSRYSYDSTIARLNREAGRSMNAG